MGGRAVAEPNISNNSASSACEQGTEWQSALDLLAAMVWAVIEPNTTYDLGEKGAEWQMSLFMCVLENSSSSINAASYNAALQAVQPCPIGKCLLQRGFATGLYASFCMEGESCLDLHSLSPAAAWHAVMR